MDASKFDLPLFTSLNQEYRGRRVAAPLTKAGERRTRAERRAARLDKLFALEGKRVLDLGCGRGELAYELAAKYGCSVIGVDVQDYPEWSQRTHDNLCLRNVDLSDAHDIAEGSIDVIYSFSVMEHVRHPFRMLRACRDLLSVEGQFLLVAHLYRSATGSHRAREIFFPWPHLLFTDDVFEEYYRSQGLRPMRPAWLNKLTYADYFRYFELLGLGVDREFHRERELDREFYERFCDELSKYAEFDLRRNAVEVILSVREPPSEGALDVEPRRTRVNVIEPLVQDAHLSRLWQCGARKSVESAGPSLVRVRSASEPYYLATRGGAFRNPPKEPEHWPLRPMEDATLTMSFVEDGTFPELSVWVIEYDEARRLSDHRWSIEGPGELAFTWRTHPKARSLRLALKVGGRGSVLLGPMTYFSFLPGGTKA